MIAKPCPPARHRQGLPDHPPYPVTLQTVVPQLHLTRIQPGATVAVNVARADRQQVLVDWNRPR